MAGLVVPRTINIAECYGLTNSGIVQRHMSTDSLERIGLKL
jgi:hypothetical protein